LGRFGQRRFLMVIRQFDLIPPDLMTDLEWSAANIADSWIPARFGHIGKSRNQKSITA